MFSDVLETILWEETTERIHAKTDKDVRRALSKSVCDVEDFMALIRLPLPLSGDDGTTEPPIYGGTFRQDHFHVRTSLSYECMYQLVCLLRIPDPEPDETDNFDRTGDCQ